MATAIYGFPMTLRPMTLRAGDQLPELDLTSAAGSWNSGTHRSRGVPLVLILHRHLA